MNLKIHVKGYAIPIHNLIAMKLFIVMLIVSVNVSANAYSQKVDIIVKDAPLLDVMRQVRKQTGYYFFFAAATIKNARPVSLNLKQASVEYALATIFKDQPFSYEIKGKAITVKEKDSPSSNYVEKIMNIIHFISITGKVVDEQGQPLPGASIRAGGKVAVTDANGDFTLSDIAENASVEISFIGYITKSVKAGNGSFLLVQMIVKAGQLEEQVIKGYYTTTKELNTGSVGTLKAVDISKQPISDPLMALQGRITGLYISQSSGVPGAGLSVNLRGINSLKNGTSPLYIIDGIPFGSNTLSQIGNATGFTANSPFTSIRPDDIESIDILRDADATAIYGSRGANGVILITTKKGKVGKTKVDFNVYRGTSKVTKFLDLLNTKQYLEMRREAFLNDNATPSGTRYDVNGVWGFDRYTDWQKVMIGGTAEAVDGKVTISGGNESTQYLVGAGYRRETTVFPGDFNNEIGSMNLNLTNRSESRRFLTSLSMNYTNNNYNLPVTDFARFIYIAPNAPAIYDSKGNINWENNTFLNPIANLLQKSNSVTDNLISNINLSYQITDGLEIKANGGYNLAKMDETQIIPNSSFRPINPDDAPYNRAYIEGDRTIKTWIFEPQLNYKKQFGSHHIDALLATTMQETVQKGSMISAVGFASDALIANPSSALFKDASTSYSQYRYNAVFARIGYNYMEKYIVNLTGRRDGSSRFGPGKRFGNFGAIGAAWIFTKEEFVQSKIPFLSLGKIRASIGKTGNDQLGDYQYLSTYSSNSDAYFGTTGLVPTKLTNPYYGWENINKIEGGLELGFVKNRFLLTANFYRNRTNNQLVGYSLPVITGFSTIIANLPAIIENKGLEVELNTINVENEAFTWISSFNISFPKNKLISYPNIESSSFAQRYIIGQPLTIALGYEYIGVDPTTGLYSFKDFNKDGQITFDQDAIVPLIRRQQFFGGMNNRFEYKGISLDIFFQFVKQTGSRFISNGLPGAYSLTGANQPTTVLDRWRKKGDKAVYQKFNQDRTLAEEANDRLDASTARVIDASFIRLKNVMLSWSVPAQWQDRIKINGLRVYFQAQNLLTITKFKGADPESQNANNPQLSPLKTLTAGLQLTL